MKAHITTTPQEQEQEQEEDILSLCDLPTYSTDSSSPSIDDHETSKNEPFEFFPLTFPSNDELNTPIVFFGKFITSKESPSHKRKAMPLNKTALGKSGSRSKWRFFVFGLQKSSVPNKMEMGNMRDRLSRKRPMSLEEIFEKSMSSDNNNNIKSNNRNSKLEKSFSYLIRSLSCRGGSVLN